MTVSCVQRRLQLYFGPHKNGANYVTDDVMCDSNKKKNRQRCRRDQTTLISHRSRSHGFLVFFCVRDIVATCGQYLALMV